MAVLKGHLPLPNTTTVCMYVCMYVCSIYVCMYLCMYVSMYVCMYVCMYVMLWIYVWIYMCVYVWVYVCLRLPSTATATTQNPSTIQVVAVTHMHSALQFIVLSYGMCSQYHNTHQHFCPNYNTGCCRNSYALRLIIYSSQLRHVFAVSQHTPTCLPPITIQVVAVTHMNSAL